MDWLFQKKDMWSGPAPPSNWVQSNGQVTVEYHIEKDGFSIYINEVFIKYVST